MPSVAELMRALPESDESQIRTEEIPPAWPAEMSLRPVPVGRLRRVGLLGTLQAKIGAAYLFYWIRGWFKNAAEKERLLAELNWKTAARLLDTMSYLRGAVMKVGQTLANFPDIAPQAFVETLDRLHFDAPPMHWSLLREMVHNELGSDPKNIFASFDEKASAAASLGQVHRARLRTGEEVMVKIQYPGIARTVREDIRNLLIFMLPARFSRDWENTKEQFADLRMRLERETDYEQEAATQQKARLLFREDDDIVVPRVFPQFTTARVLTMDLLKGKTLDQFVATNPSQPDRDEFARKLCRAWYRLYYAGRLIYGDVHPGNFLFLDDGRLGLIDFGFMAELDDTVWELCHKIDRAQTTGRREDRIAVLKEWHYIGDGPEDRDRLNLADAMGDWTWRPRYCGGEFNFGDESEFRRGVDLMFVHMRKRYTRARSCMPSVARANAGFRAVLYQLKAKIDIAPIAEEEVRAAGWDRSDYAPR
jgi:predicted unusual protein kinase regulating ubiquinone biosynthesis (AarF/ABC1/UbiB family)